MAANRYKLPGLIMGMCRGTGAVFQAPDSPGSVLFSSGPSHLSLRRAPSKVADLELPAHWHPPNPPDSPHALGSLSIFWEQQPSQTRDYLDQAGNLFLPPGEKNKKTTARLLGTKQAAAPRAKRTPASDYQKDATPSPAES